MGKKLNFNVDEKVLVTNQYFIEQKELSMPVYATVIEVIDYAGKVRIEDHKGDRYLIDAIYLEEDTLDMTQINSEDGTRFDMDKFIEEKDDELSKQDKTIKWYMYAMHHSLQSDNKKLARYTRDKIENELYMENDDNVRIINELNLRRAFEKYYNTMTDINDDLFDSSEIDDEEYQDRYNKLEDIRDLIDAILETYGIFQEIKDNKNQRERLEKTYLESQIKAARQKQRDPLQDLFAAIMQDPEFQKDMQAMRDEQQSQSAGRYMKIDKDGKLREMTDEEIKEFEEKKKQNQTQQTGLMNKISTQVKTPKEIPDCLTDMTALAAKGRYNEIIGREEEIDSVSETLARKEIRNPLLIGKPGAGKTAVVEELVKRAYNGEIPHLKNKRFYELRMNDLVAGTMYRGQLEEKLQNVMKVLEDDPNVVLFIDEVHMIVQAGSTANDKNDVSNALKPYLTSEISIIGATTFDEYRATFANDGALARRFNPIAIEEKSKEESIDIICKVKHRFEEYHGVELSEDMVRRIINEIEGRKSDNSLIAGALTAVDTICTKMKIKNLTEKQAFKKWTNEVVTSVDRTNKGGKTQNIGFDFGNDLDEEDNLDILDPDELDELDGTLEEQEDCSKVIYLEGEEYLKIEQKDDVLANLIHDIAKAELEEEEAEEDLDEEIEEETEELEEDIEENEDENDDDETLE